LKAARNELIAKRGRSVSFIEKGPRVTRFLKKRGWSISRWEEELNLHRKRQRQTRERRREKGEAERSPRGEGPKKSLETGDANFAYLPAGDNPLQKGAGNSI